MLTILAMMLSGMQVDAAPACSEAALRRGVRLSVSRDAGPGLTIGSRARQSGMAVTQVIAIPACLAPFTVSFWNATLLTVSGARILVEKDGSAAETPYGERAFTNLDDRTSWPEPMLNGSAPILSRHVAFTAHDGLYTDRRIGIWRGSRGSSVALYDVNASGASGPLVILTSRTAAIDVTITVGLPDQPGHGLFLLRRTTDGGCRRSPCSCRPRRSWPVFVRRRADLRDTPIVLSLPQDQAVQA